MRITMRLTRVLTLLVVLAVVMMVVMDAAEANREGRRGGGGGGGRRGGRGGGGGGGRVRRLPLRGLEKCLCGRYPETQGCTTCFDKLRNNTITDWATFGECLNNVDTPVPTPGFNSTCVVQSSPRRHR